MRFVALAFALLALQNVAFAEAPAAPENAATEAESATPTEHSTDLKTNQNSHGEVLPEEDPVLRDAVLSDEFLDGSAAKNAVELDATAPASAVKPELAKEDSAKSAKKPGKIRSHFEHDTLYMKPASKRLRLRASVEGYGTDLEIGGTVDDDEFSTELKSKSLYMLNLAAYYHGFSASISVNPLTFTGDDKDFETYLDWYGNWFGIDVSYSSTNTFEGDLESGGHEASVGSNVVKQQLIILNGYFVWSGNKFSYPAALGPSWRQLKSAGSFMVGVGAIGRKLEVKENEKLGSGKFDLMDLVITGGIGYGYNLVPGEGWLLHLSTLPQFVVYNYGRMKNNGDRNNITTNFPNLMVVGRISVTKYFGRYFAGLTSTVSTYDIGDGDDLETTSVKWQARIFFGVQL